jgi:phosphoglucosamine mutase
MTKLPQLLINVKVAGRPSLGDAPAVREAAEREAAALEGRGRVLIRPSGTEPLIRVMVEAPDAEECQQVAGRLASLVERELG